MIFLFYGVINILCSKLFVDRTKWEYRALFHDGSCLVLYGMTEHKLIQGLSGTAFVTVSQWSVVLCCKESFDATVSDDYLFVV